MPTDSFQVIPVVDVKNERTVHAVAGRRAHYQPVATIFHPDPDPLAIAHAFHDILGLTSLYLADLDAIAGHPPRIELFREILRTRKTRLWIDAGITSAVSIEPLLSVSSIIVVGLETLQGPSAMAEIVERAGSDRVMFSLDLDQGRPRIATAAAWPSRDPLAIAEHAADLGVRRMLLLDLASVGTGSGLASIELMQAIRVRRPGLELSIGGGIASIDQVTMARRAGAAAVLVASALHDGRIGRNELRGIEGEFQDRIGPSETRSRRGSDVDRRP